MASWLFEYNDMDPEAYRAELIEMGASDEDAEAAVENLRECQK
jgi:hypothetical protein